MVGNGGRWGVGVRVIAARRRSGIGPELYEVSMR